MNFDEVPVEQVSVLPALKKRAKELGLVINKDYIHKVEWSEVHGGRCMCAFRERKCPCSNIKSDLKRYAGHCLCNVLYTKEAYKKYRALKKKKAQKKDTKIKVGTKPFRARKISLEEANRIIKENIKKEKLRKLIPKSPLPLLFGL